jgi:fibronectin type 3 domain-containing protein
MKTLKTLALSLILTAFCGLHAQAQSAAGFTKLGSATAMTFTDTSCGNQTTCYYQVTALDSLGHESPAALCGTAQLCFGTNQVVAVLPSSGTHSVVLSWSASSTAGVTYNVYRAVGPLPAGSVNATVN